LLSKKRLLEWSTRRGKVDAGGVLFVRQPSQQGPATP